MPERFTDAEIVEFPEDVEVKFNFVFADDAKVTVSFTGFGDDPSLVLSAIRELASPGTFAQLAEGFASA